MNTIANEAQLCSGLGSRHTNEPERQNRKPYLGITFSDIQRMVDNPTSVKKENAQWIIPSTLKSRNFGKQRQEGEYWLLWLDLDKTPPPIEELKKQMFFIIGVSDFEIYNTSSATEDNQKCRILIPLSQWLNYEDWTRCQEILNDKLTASNIEPDRANERAGQLCYLPNKGKGKLYNSCSIRNGDFLSPLEWFKNEILAIGERLEEETQRLDVLRQEAQEKRATLQYDGSKGGLINAFNETITVVEILLRNGYLQRGLTFCHPNSTTGNYSASINPETGRVHALSTKDPLYSENGAHDAFSCFERLEHNDNREAALKDAGDNYLAIGGVSWNKVKQREYMRKNASQTQTQTEEGLKGLKGLKASNNAVSNGANKKAKGANLAPKLGELAYKTPKYPVEALGSLANLAEEIAVNGQVEVSMVGQSLLATLSLCAQGTYEVETLTGEVPLSLYCLTIAGSGEGKSTAENIALHEVNAYQKAKHEAYTNECEADTDKTDIRNPYMICNDATTQGIIKSFNTGHPSQGLFTAEGATMFSGWLMSKEQKLKTAGDLNRFWDGAAISVIRGGEGRMQLYNRRFCAHVLIQPDAVQEAINDNSLSTIGLFPRFLIAYPAPLKPRKFKEFNYWNSQEVKSYWKNCHELLIKSSVEEDGACSDFTTIPLHPMAKATLIQFFENMELSREKDNELHDLKAFATRATEQACRIAGCLAAYDGKKEIDQATMINGIKLATHSLDIWLGMMQGREASEHDQWALQLYKWMSKRKGRKATEGEMLQRVIPKSLRNAHKRDIALSVLREHGMVKPSSEMIEGVTKRAYKTWEVS